VIGIVASRLIETYYRPTIILTESEGKLAGSARSIRGFDLYEAIYECREHLLQFGGHTFAAGLSMKPEQLPAFAEKFESVARQRLKPEDMVPEIEIEGEVQLGELTDKFYRLIQRFAPFGPGNMRPLLLSRGVRDTGFARLLKDEHLKLNLQQQNNGVRFNAIGFGMARHLDLVRKGPVDIVYTLEENEWNGQISLQLQLKDIRASEQ
jgi:single-stranded-DNA-specific exonuclease